jgi:hypothetical protein
VATASSAVYDPGGLTCLVDDFIVEHPDLWRTVGKDLLKEACQQAQKLGAVQVVVVCGPFDQPKRDLLLSQGLFVASEWFTRPFQPDDV